MSNTRNYSLDLVRIFALFSVISVHFFLNSGFYGQPVSNATAYIMVYIRTFFMMSVPLFLLLTGYLMNKKTLSAKYYKGVTKTLGVYIIASFACVTFYKLIFPEEQSVGFLLSAFGFSGARYSWYVEMYLGLFVMIPFLNIVYNGLDSKKKKTVLLITMLALTMLPSVFNNFDFRTQGWWANPTISQNWYQLIPDWWVALYPVTYYFIGCFISEYPPRIKKLPIFLFQCAAVLGFGMLAIIRSRGIAFVGGKYQEWGGISSTVISVLTFLFISGTDTQNWNIHVKKSIGRLSDLCFGGYLMSCVFDKIIYTYMNTHVANMADKLKFFPVITLSVFVLSIANSWVINLIYKLIKKAADAIIGKIRSRRKIPEQSVM